MQHETESEISMPTSFPKRLGKLESKFDVLTHRIEELASERLPHRVTNLEGTAQSLHSEMGDIKISLRVLTEQQQRKLTEINDRQLKDSSFIRGAGWIVLPLLGVITLAVSILAFFGKG